MKLILQRARNFRTDNFSLKWATVILWLCLIYGHAQEPVEEIVDPHFNRGLILLAPEPGKIVPYGKIKGVIPGEPVWTLVQWASKYPLQPEEVERQADGTLRYFNQGKAVTLGAPDSEERDISLSVIGSAEYGTHARKGDEAWVHLLVGHDLSRKPALDVLTEARFHVEARLKKSKRIDTPDYSPRIHAAQFWICFSVQNLNQQSPGYGKYLWFGVPVYDDRERVIQGGMLFDKGTGMYIFTPPQSEYTSASTHDGRWVTLDADVLPLMKKGLKAAWELGALVESKSLADYHIAGMNMGWELPGIYDVEMQVRNLSLKTFRRSGDAGDSSKNTK